MSNQLTNCFFWPLFVITIAFLIPSTFSRCPRLNPVTDSIVHPKTDRSCKTKWPTYKDQTHCTCDYFPVSRNAAGCVTKYYILCWKRNSPRPQTDSFSFLRRPNCRWMTTVAPCRSRQMTKISIVRTTTKRPCADGTSSRSSAAPRPVTGFSLTALSTVKQRPSTLTASLSTRADHVWSSTIQPVSSTWTTTTSRQPSSTSTTTTKTSAALITTDTSALITSADIPLTSARIIPRENACEGGGVLCLHGRCMESHKLCDGVNDCKDDAVTDENERTCPGLPIICHGWNKFRCANTNICVPREAFCDGVDDCGDGHDEHIAVCAQIPCSEETGWFRCARSMRCIPEAWLCDRHPDCQKIIFEDLSDEQDAKCVGKKTCWDKAYLFKCTGNNQCLSRIQLCDGRKDCADSSDEEGQHCGFRYCRKEEFECSANRIFRRRDCIIKEAVCDGHIDCVDGADESEHLCPAGHQIDQCNHFEIKCSLSGRCIPKRWQCDGEKDCLDGSDEMQCTQADFACSRSDQYKCLNEHRCIPREWLCDRTTDCRGGDDEANCPDQGLPFNTVNDQRRRFFKL